MSEDYEVQEGDCISSIAHEHGFLWETLWNHSANSGLNQQRKDPNILMEGDIVHIPDKTKKQESGATEAKHKFKLKGVPAKLKLKLMRPKAGSSPPDAPAADGGGGGSPSNGADPDYKAPKNEEEPMKAAPYVLEVDGAPVAQGTTDGDGCVEIPILPDARAGKLIINKGSPDEKTITLDLGGMDPIDEVAGVRKRLGNLGYFCDAEGPADTSDLKDALRAFQERNSLDITGNIDDATKNKLKESHGS